MTEVENKLKLYKSLPTRERGLKYPSFGGSGNGIQVAPHAGAWIEIDKNFRAGGKESVAPHAGAWIEISSPRRLSAPDYMSLPTRERGLKLV